MVLSRLNIQIISTIITIVLGIIITPITIWIASKGLPINKISEHKREILKRTIKLSVWLLVVLAIVIIWNVGLENIWVTITGILALIAVAFFAVWSLLSNIVAGIMIYITKPFVHGDKIILYLPEEYKGKVEKIGAIFTTLKCEDEGLFRIPNNLFFQRIVKKLR